MNVPTHAAEVLLQTCHVHAYAMPALLRFWRACRATMPQRARFDDERLDHLRAQAQKPAPLVWDTRRRTFDRAPVPDYQAAIDALLRRRALWERVTAILDMQPDREAADALSALVNGPAIRDLIPFFLDLSPREPARRSAVYRDYRASVLRPFERHVLPRVAGPPQPAPVNRATTA